MKPPKAGEYDTPVQSISELRSVVVQFVPSVLTTPPPGPTATTRLSSLPVTLAKLTIVYENTQIKPSVLTPMTPPWLTATKFPNV